MNAKQIITNNKAILAAALLTLSLTGCALTPATESLNYQAQTGMAHVAHAENVTVNVVTTDSRVDKAISHKKNGFGMELAGISASEPVEVTVDKALEQELKSRGFNISKNTELKITADVTKFYNEYHINPIYASADGDVNISISVYSKERFVYSKNLSGSNHLAPVFTTGATKENLEKALEKAMADLFNDPAFTLALTSIAPAQTAAN
ncbi:YajG family lipoprotein [Sulfuriferula nivalis]|uniref:Lipoprotein n=1 Tax=Sulfuriferula nivalis TaxID=2675298 RepID=A0A809S8Q0_9PROT|nr:YajG family lipoprotein [Sulfuriferula nivalis]BBP00372.1 hypothetical protein SFSGTM_10800 [Sulfuriferula nivalis]